MELEIENLDYRWLRDWFPDENARLLVGIWQTDLKFLDLGTFYVDEVTFTNQTLLLKCLALPLEQNIRQEKKSVSWVETTLFDIVSKRVYNFWCWYLKSTGTFFNFLQK